VIPLVTIKNAFEFVRNGLSIKQSDNSVGFPITRIETIWNSSIDINRFGYADIKDIEKYKNNLLADGDILMSHINSPKHLGKSAIYEGTPKQLIHGMNLLNLRPNRKISLPKYLYFYLNSDYFKNQIKKISNQSVNQASFSSGNLKKLKIPLPSLPEQQKIAAILDAADSLRQKDQQLIEKYNALSQSLFLEIFGDPASNPMGWDKKSLKEVGVIYTGNTPARENLEYYGSDIEWIKTNNINTPNMYLTPAEEHLSEAGLKIGRCVEPGSLLVTCIAGSKKVIGNVAIADRKVAFNQQINSFTPFKGNVLFFYSLFIAGKKHIQSFSTDSMKGMINKSKFESIDFIIPPITLQNQFAERIQSIESQKQQAQASLQKSEALFNSLLQRAFKGELT